MLTQREAVSGAGPRALLVATICAGLLLGCAPRRAEPPVQAPPPATAGALTPQGARVFDIDPQRSVVTIRVYRAGPLAKLGHNHVVTSGQESGLAWQGREPAGSGFELRLPVASLVVDDPAARAAAGPGFEGTVPESAREGTYRNMLRPEVLDGERFPEIVVRSNGLGGTWERPVAIAEVTLKDVTRRIEVPLELSQADGTLVVRGSFHIQQAEFGMTPFSVAGGAIQVADGVDVSFEVVATAR
jgi:hypothetical protein